MNNFLIFFEQKQHEWNSTCCGQSLWGGDYKYHTISQYQPMLHDLAINTGYNIIKLHNEKRPCSFYDY
jgi:hypothetical protein